ncbi:MAG: YfiR family protein, partial [Candidatus Latescibacteria bacterium]|nr:YfiR family protein [Candidatus Latescibacterota bacterium]
GAVSRNNIDILYVAPLRALGVKTITGVSRAKRILTLTGVPDYVESGLAVGIGIKGEKPRVIINSPAAKAEGADFSSQLLKLAKVIK